MSLTWEQLFNRLEPQECGRGHPKVDMVRNKSGRTTLGKKYVIYKCPTCGREIEYKYIRGRFRSDRTVMKIINEGDIDPNKSKFRESYE